MDSVSFILRAWLSLTLKQGDYEDETFTDPLRPPPQRTHNVMTYTAMNMHHNLHTFSHKTALTTANGKSN